MLKKIYKLFIDICTTLIKSLNLVSASICLTFSNPTIRILTVMQ